MDNKIKWIEQLIDWGEKRHKWGDAMLKEK
jgi:hypothetical protein